MQYNFDLAVIKHNFIIFSNITICWMYKNHVIIHILGPLENKNICLLRVNMYYDVVSIRII